MTFIDPDELHKFVVQQVVEIPYPTIIKFISEQAADGTHALDIYVVIFPLNKVVSEFGYAI